MKRLKFYRVFPLFLMLVVGMLISSCDHKEFCYDHVHTVNIRVRFDWQNAPDANPKSMTTWFYPVDAPNSPLRMDFPGRDGGNARLEFGRYEAIALNADEDWIKIHNHTDIETFEVRTNDVQSLALLGFDVRSIPRAPMSEDERMAITPGMLWSNRQSGLAFVRDLENQEMVFYPEEAICHYTVKFIDVENFKYLRGVRLDSSLSGMAEGFMHGSHQPSGNKVTLSLSLDPDSKTQTLNSAFLTFGECPGDNGPHVLSVYMLFDDGSATHYAYDVTSQIKSAPDPHHVDIVISGMKIPKPISNGGGFRPDVIDWDSEYINISM